LDPALTYVRNPFKRINELNMQRLKQNKINRSGAVSPNAWYASS
jgi:hypothetical protein